MSRGLAVAPLLSQTRLTHIAVWVIGVLALADAMIFASTGLRLIWHPLLGILIGAMLLGVVGWVYAGPRAVPRLALFAQLGLRLILLTATAETLNMLLDAQVKLPLWDSRFAAADAAMGLNWADLASWVSAHPLMNAAFNISYAALGPEFIILISLLALTGRSTAAISFWRLFAVTALGTVFLGVLLPAAGPFVWFHEPGAMSVPYVRQYAALRSGEMRNIDLSSAQGLVSFPSFHACLAVLCMRASRAFGGALSWLLYGLNVLIIAAAPTVGGHYFVDILGGIALAFGAILVMEFGARAGGVLSPDGV